MLSPVLSDGIDTRVLTDSVGRPSRLVGTVRLVSREMEPAVVIAGTVGKEMDGAVI